MKKTVSRLLALALTAALVLTGCGGGTTTEETCGHQRKYWDNREHGNHRR